MIDPELAPSRCPDCGEDVVLGAAKTCPLCRARDANALAPRAVPAGPWPRLALVRGEPLPGGAAWLAVPAGTSVLDLGEGALGTLVSNGRDEVRLVLNASGVRIDGALATPGASVKLAPGARLHAGGRELVRA